MVRLARAGVLSSSIMWTPAGIVTELPAMGFVLPKEVHVAAADHGIGANKVTIAGLPLHITGKRLRPVVGALAGVVLICRTDVKMVLTHDGAESVA